MLATLITVLILSGGAATGLLYDLSELKKQVKEFVVEDANRSAALEIVKAMKERNKAHGKLVKNTSNRLDQSLGNHAVTDAELDAIWGEYMEGVNSFHRDLVDLRFDLKGHVSRDEWKAIFSSSADEV